MHKPVLFWQDEALEYHYGVSLVCLDLKPIFFKGFL